eukprot:IDg9456t1
MIPSTLSRQVRKVRQDRTKSSGRPKRLSKTEELTILERVNTFTALGCPFDIPKLSALMKLFVDSLPVDLQAKIALINNSPGKAWMTERQGIQLIYLKGYGTEYERRLPELIELYTACFLEAP